MLVGMFVPGPVEMIVVLVIAVLLFGNRLPKLARSVGSSVIEFRRGIKETEKEIAEIEKETKDILKES